MGIFRSRAHYLNSKCQFAWIRLLPYAILGTAMFKCHKMRNMSGKIVHRDRSEFDSLLKYGSLYGLVDKHFINLDYAYFIS